jgi:hypothetical protein
MSYHYISVDIVMRDCQSKEDAVAKLAELMPKYPDENTVYMESWDVINVREGNNETDKD